jgi:hypothetical protein
MSKITFSGAIQPTVFFAYQSVKVPGARPTADEFYTYVMANEAVFQFSFEVTTATGVVTISRSADEKNPKFDAEHRAYICEPTSAAVLNAIADASETKVAPATLKSVKVWLKPFFFEMLKLLTRTAADTFNLARPDASSAKAVEDSFSHSLKGDKVSVTHPANFQREIKEIPCDVTGVNIQPAAVAGQPPRVTLFVVMRVRDRLPPADRDEVVRILIAADYSKIYKFGKSVRPNAWFATETRVPPVAATGIEKSLKVWEKNVAHYLWNHTSFDRAEKIKKEIIDRAITNMGKSQLEVVQGIRDDIDARMVTANHWGDLREDFKTERYQRKLSDVFGAIHQSQFLLASPVALIRFLSTRAGQVVLLDIDVAKTVNLTLDEEATFALAWGVGHCGEHSKVSYSVVRALMNAGNAAKFASLILTGNANVDHAFVVGGLRVSKVIHTRFTREAFKGAPAGTNVDVWDLREELAKNPGIDGFVLDPYLAPTRQARTAKELLSRLNGPSRGVKRTDVLSFREQHPPGPAPAEVTSFNLKGL